MKNLVYIVCFIFFVSSLSAQSFRKLNEDLGLSSRRTYSICQDKNGFIWISTKLSIDRYDGHNVTSYNLSSPNTTSDNIGFNFVTIDPDSTVWAYTQNGDIYKYSGKSDEFVYLFSIRSYYQSFSVILNNIYFENSGSILLATSKGVLRYDKNRNKVSNLAANIDVYHIMKHDENYILSTTSGMYIVNFPISGKNKIISHILTKNFVNKVFYDSKYQLFWIATISDGIYIFSEKTKKFTARILPELGKPIRSIIQYSPSLLAVGIDGKGIYFINRENFSIDKTIVKSDDSDLSIAGNSVWDVYLDKQDILWVATYHEGVSFSDYSKLSFQNIVHENRNINSLANNFVNTVLEDSDKNLWFGTNNGISIFYPQRREWKHLFQQDKMATGNVILSLCESADGKIWAGGYAFGAAEIDRNTLAIKRYSVKEKDAIIGTDHIYSIYKDEFSNNLWIGGIYGNITSYNTQTKKSRKYDDSALRCFHSYSDSTILLGLYRGIYMLNIATGKKIETKIHSIVNCILKDIDKSYWVATTKDGLLHYDFRTDSLTRYTKATSEISSNHIYAIEKDEDGMLWLSTENGLNKFDPKTERFIEFDKRDGLVSNQFTPGASIRLSSGDILMGSADGAVIFNPIEIEKTNTRNTYPLIFTDFKIFGNSVKVDEKDSPLQRTINEIKTIILAHNRNYFSFSFTQPNYQSSDKTEYSYFLQDYDLNWSTLSTNNTASYSKMQPGKYTFRVRSYVDKHLQEERQIKVIVKQPWWNSFLAWIIYLSSFMVSIYLIIRFFSRKKEKKFMEEKMDFFINTAHDIITPLNLIESPLKDISIISNLSEEIKYLVSLALKNTQKLNQFIHQLIDFQRITLQTDTLLVRKNKVKDFFLTKVTAYRAIASQKFISLNITIPEAEKDVLFDKEKISKIIDNLLSNSIKHTPFGGKIEIIVNYAHDGWSFAIKDSGFGIPRSNKNIIYKYLYKKHKDLDTLNVGSGAGLMMVDALVRIHQGKITFKSKLNEGTIFTIILPYVFDDKHVDTFSMTEDVEILSSEKKTNENILIVQSENDLSDYLSNAFRNDYNADVQKTGNEALNQISKFQPKIIITDELLSDMNGLEFCGKIKENDEISSTPIIVITNNSDSGTIKKIFKSGANDYIKKPFDTEVLKMKVENLLSLQKDWQKKALSDTYYSNIVASNNNRDKEFMDNLIQLLEENISNPDLNINLLCGELALSRTLLYNRITQLTGDAPNEFIRKIRLKSAAKLLIEGKYSIAEVSTMVGIDNPKYFSRIFKEYYNVSPKNYLK